MIQNVFSWIVAGTKQQQKSNARFCFHSSGVSEGMEFLHHVHLADWFCWKVGWIISQLGQAGTAGISLDLAPHPIKVVNTCKY